MSGYLALLRDDPGRRDEYPLLSRLTEAMAYRGPDAQDHQAVSHCGLGFALLDTTDGRRVDAQPRQEEGLWIVADARLDGRRDLAVSLGRPELAGAPDSQLILLAYQKWGMDCAARLLGDFSFALWDPAQRRLMAARDPLGMRPLYWAPLRDGLLCGNTLHALRRHPEVDQTLDEAAVADYLLFGANYDLSSTVFRGVRRLPPAHALSWSPGQGAPRAWRYTELQALAPQEVPRRFEDAAEQYRGLLEDAVEDRLTSDRGVVFMSGGMDSPTVAALAWLQLEERPGPVRFEAYTAVYRRLLEDPEEAYARAVSQQLGMPHHVEAVDDDRYFEGWGQRFLSAEPSDGNMLPLNARLYRRVQAFSRVTFTGDGADPALIHPADDLWRQLARGRLDRVGLYLWRSFQERRLPPLGLRTAWLERQQRKRWRQSFPPWLRGDWVARLGLEERWRQIRFPEGEVGERGEALASLVDPIWVAVFEAEDPGSSGFLLERRHPFFDLRLLRFSLALPAPWCRGKGLLRQAVGDLLPSEVLHRPKTPLAGVPHHSFVAPPRILLEDLPVAKEQLMQYLDASAVCNVLDRVEGTLSQVDMTPSAPADAAAGPQRAGTSSQSGMPLDDVCMRALNLAFWLHGLASEGKGSI